MPRKPSNPNERLYAVNDGKTYGKYDLIRASEPPKRVVSGLKMGRRTVRQITFEGGEVVKRVDEQRVAKTLCLRLLAGGSVMVPRSKERALLR